MSTIFFRPQCVYNSTIWYPSAKYDWLTESFIHYFHIKYMQIKWIHCNNQNTHTTEPYLQHVLSCMTHKPLWLFFQHTHWGQDKIATISLIDDFFKCILLYENVRILLKTSWKFVLMVSINNIPVLLQIMAWRRPGDKPLSEPMMVNLLTYICVIRLQWVNYILTFILRPIMYALDCMTRTLIVVNL